MTFLSPLWLFGLLPWLAAVLYLLLGRRRRVDVPFLELWKGPVEGPKPKRRLGAPPLALVLALLAILLAVLAAGGPAVRSPLGAGEPVTVIVDRGLTMSAGAPPRYVGAAEAAGGEIVDTFGVLGPVELLTLPGSEPRRTDASDWVSLVRQLPPTAADTTAALRPAVAAALADGPGPVVVLTDKELGVGDERLVVVPPAGPLGNAGVARLAARESPKPQVMVTVRSRGVGGPASLRVTTAGNTVEQPVALAPDGQGREGLDVFIDVPAIGQTVEAELVLDDAQRRADDVVGDNKAWLVREAGWPRVEPHTPLPPELRHMVDVYAAARPAGDGSRRVLVVASAEDAPPGEPAIVVPRAGAAPGLPVPGDGVFEVRPHPVNEGVNWAALRAGLRPAGGAPPAGWEPVVAAGGRVLVAARAGPAPGVWVGFDTARPARTSDFVVFWANVFNWAGRGGERFASHPVGRVEGDWEPLEFVRPGEGIAPPGNPETWPGLYRRRSDGSLRAFHPPPLPAATPPPQTDWRGRLKELAARSPDRLLRLDPPLLTVAALLVALAALTWRRAPRAYRPGPGPREDGRQLVPAGTADPPSPL